MKTMHAFGACIVDFGRLLEALQGEIPEVYSLILIQSITLVIGNGEPPFDVGLQGTRQKALPGVSAFNLE